MRPLLVGPAGAVSGVVTTILLLAVAAALVVYLLVALLDPERF